MGQELPEGGCCGMPRGAHRARRRQQLRDTGVHITYPRDFKEPMPEASPRTWSKRQERRAGTIDRIKSSHSFRLATISGALPELLDAPDPAAIVSKRQWEILAQAWHRKLRDWCEENVGTPISL